MTGADQAGPSRRLHLLVPSLGDVAVSKGGTCMYRGVALAAGAVTPVTCYQTVPPAAGGDSWHPDAPPVCTLPAGALLAALAAALRPGDLVVKFAGAVGMDADWRADAQVARLAAERGCASAYLDPDAPYRLGLLGPAPPLAASLPRYSAVVPIGGGPRAVAEYAALAGDAALAGAGRVQHVSTAVSALPIEPAPDLAAPRDIDLFVPVAAGSAREARIGAALRRWTAGDPGPRRLRLAVAGDWPDRTGDRVASAPLGDPRLLLPTYRRSKYVLNVLRGEFAGYSETAAARVFEAALGGAVLLTERFAGLERVLAPGRECVVLDDLDDAPRVIRELPEAERAGIAARAAPRALRERSAAAAELAGVLAGLPPAEPMPDPAGWERTVLRRHDLWADPGRPRRIGVLPDVSEPFAADLARRLPGARLSRVDTDAAGGAAVDTLAVRSDSKDALDETLRGCRWLPAAVLVEVSSPGSARGIRWLPGRDWLPPGTDRWPWLDAPAGGPATLITERGGSRCFATS